MRRRGGTPPEFLCTIKPGQFFALHNNSPNPGEPSSALSLIRLRANRYVEALLGSEAYVGELDNGAVVQGFTSQPPPPQFVTALLVTPNASVALEYRNDGLAGTASTILRVQAVSDGIVLSLFMSVRQTDMTQLLNDALSGLFTAVTAWRSIAIRLAKDSDSSSDENELDQNDDQSSTAGGARDNKVLVMRERLAAYDDMFGQFKQSYEDDISHDMYVLGSLALAQASACLRAREQILSARAKDAEVERMRPGIPAPSMRKRLLRDSLRLENLSMDTDRSKRPRVTVFEGSDESDGDTSARNGDGESQNAADNVVVKNEQSALRGSDRPTTESAETAEAFESNLGATDGEKYSSATRVGPGGALHSDNISPSFSATTTRASAVTEGARADSPVENTGTDSQGNDNDEGSAVHVIRSTQTQRSSQTLQSRRNTRTKRKRKLI